ncbi:AhpC/TSA family protein [Actinoplanes sp. NPDC048796]|uniref:AhpC/TSA family protein n=1 Tax=unclassified Actinoplanes TaxID=2626549 RepID=UPI00340DC28B
MCNLHLQSIVRRHAEIEAAGIREIVVFHSPAEELRQYDLPFAVIPDPEKRLYREYGVQASPRSLLHPRAWWPLIRAVARSSVMIARRREAGPAGTQAQGRLGLPADFLIAPDGRTVTSKFGHHAYDQWDVDEILRVGQLASHGPISMDP